MGQSLSAVTAFATIVSIVVMVLYVAYRVRTRNRITLGDIQYINVDLDQVPNADDIRSMINEKVREITRIHSPIDGLHAEGESDGISEVQLANEALEGGVGILVEFSDIPMSFVFRLLDTVFPRVSLDGEVKGDGRFLKTTARLRQGRKTIDTIYVQVKRNQGDTVDRLVDELAYKLIVTSGSNDQLRASGATGTSNWMAFRSLTEALEIVSSEPSVYSLDSMDVTNHVLGLLRTAVRRDPDYARAHYNMGAVLYNTYVGSDDNARALEHFENAITVLESADAGNGDDEQKTKLLSMAYIGQSRCYSQMVHRFKPGTENAEKAREAAARALELNPEAPDALYAMGFAWHCTETLDDIEKGARYYDQIIAKHPNKFAVVHNNYGYILLERAKILRAEGHLAESHHSLTLAVDQIKQALKSNPTPRIKDFAHSNLGRANRLLGKEQAALDDARRALKFQTSSRYTGGLQDLAETYLAFGHHDDALATHRAALNSTSDHEHRQKLVKRFATELGQAGIDQIQTPTSVGSEQEIEAWLGLVQDHFTKLATP